ncbi:MAG TPA: carbon storage regulator, partial [Pirellulales bacterium]|nr:carbon storage regulator [Pirellulales bacterium]
MLVLSRRCGEEIVIGQHVIVRVLGVNGSAVRLGFEAPPEVRIKRREIYDRERVERHDG